MVSVVSPSNVVDPGNVAIIGNVADDIEVLGLHVSPDLDSIVYTLTGLADEERGWGRAAESWNALTTVSELGGESWFRLGDRDIGLHLVRTELLREGASLSEATERIAHALGLECALLPATDDPLRTFLETPAGPGAPASLPAGVRAVVTRTLMTDDEARRRLAHAVLDAAGAVAS